MNTLSRILATTLLSSLSIGAIGCASVSMELPDQFLELETETGPLRLRATTPDEARLRVRAFEVEDGGDLEFWDQSLRFEFVEYRGYTECADSQPVRDADGRQGIARFYASPAPGSTRRYMVALFVDDEESGDDSEVVVVEFSASGARFDELLPEVLESLKTLDVES